MTGGFSLNGAHCSEYCISVRRIGRPMKPEKRVTKQRIPGRHGTYDITDNTFENRLISVDCTVNDGGSEALPGKLNAISSWVNHGGALEFDSEPGRFYQAEAWSDMALDETLFISEFTIVFECYPLAQSAPHQLDVPISQTGQDISIDTVGSFETPCIIQIKNTGSAPITNIILEYRKEV
ncbi:MAG: distal tail protein Dit [Acetanaerobacterium sp.]